MINCWVTMMDEWLFRTTHCCLLSIHIKFDLITKVENISKYITSELNPNFLYSEIIEQFKINYEKLKKHLCFQSGV